MCMNIIAVQCLSTSIAYCSIAYIQRRFCSTARRSSLEQEVKGLDQSSWDEQKCLVMKDILIAKFTQHDHLKKYLIDTKDKTLAAANGRDSYFAIGLPLTHPDVLDSTKWVDNSNRLGKILMEIRQELRSELS